MRAEGGFTLIELLIGFVLIGIVCGLAATVIIRGLSGSAETATTARARADAAEVAERFGADVRGARSLGRDGAKIADTADLVRAVQTDGNLYALDGSLLDWRDVTVAAPNQVTFQSDVVDEASGSESLPECVTWMVANGSGGWYLRRIARAYTVRCAGAGTVHEDDAMTAPTKDAPTPGSAGTPALFSYLVANPSGGSCASSVLNGTLTSHQRNRVVGVRIDFTSLVRHGKEATRSALRNEIGIRSRAASDYQLAMGCTS